MLSKVLTLQGITLAAAIESLVAPRLWPEMIASRSHLLVVFLIFAANYALLVLYHVAMYPFFLSPLRHMPGPKTGWTLIPRSMAATDESSGEVFLKVMKEYPGHDMVLLNVFRHELLVTGPRPLADLLVHRAYDFIKPQKIGGFLKSVLGDGLVVVEGDQHKFLRKNSLPAFSFRHIKDLYPMMWDKANMLTTALNEELKETAGGTGTEPIIELNTWASRATLDIIGSAGLGREFNTLKKAEDPLLKVYEELLEPSREKIMYFVFSSLLGLNFVKLLPWKMNQTFSWIVNSLDEICRPMMQEKRDVIKKESDNNGHFDVLSLLVRSDNFSDRELIDQLLTYLAAGHETTSSALSWASYLLAKHPSYQTALREEIKQSAAGILPSSSPENNNLAPTLESLPLLNGIINETLRLYPTVPVTIREAIRDTRLADQFIPRGTRIIVSPWATNRCPEIWGKDAETFRPERWITCTTTATTREEGEGMGEEEKVERRPNTTGGEGMSNYNFLTFLHGPRSCIGQGFARAELRCLLAAMVRGFEWEMGMDEGDVVPGGTITIKPARGMWLKLRSLDGEEQE